ncbi:unnamed protein product [marine sediment metagenome]|uniref:Uncharacterized protein n=1 Tax=marine sediment metagenome TaxID=412755 RepID=X0T169_9ZZZZ
MINKKRLRKALEEHLIWDKGYDPSEVRDSITIKRKYKPKLEKTPKGSKYKRVSYLAIEIIE